MTADEYSPKGSNMTDALSTRLGRHSRQAASLLTEGIEMLAHEMLRITDEATQYDFAVALDNLLTALGADGEMVTEIEDRPHTDDTRRLVERLMPNGVAQRVTGIIAGIVLVVSSIADEELRNDVKAPVLAFIQTIKGTAPAVDTTVKPQFKLKSDPAA